MPISIAWGQAASVEAPASLADLPPDVAAELAQIWRPWQFTGEVSSSVGYDSNIFLSPSQASAGGFVREALDTYLLRLPTTTDDFSGFAYVNGNTTDFFSGASRPDEQEWYGGAEARWQPIAAVQVAINGQAFYQDQVLDLSATEAEPLIAKLRVSGVLASARMRWSFWRGFWFEGQAQQQRNHYRGFDENFDSRGGAARLGWSLEKRVDASFTYAERRRDYFERTDYTVAGLPLDAPLLHFDQREGKLNTEFHFEGYGDWTAAASAGYLANRDNGSGYFNYDEKYAQVKLGWERGPWKMEADGGVQRYAFLVQVVGIGISPTGRLIEDYDGGLKLERKLGERWKVFAEERWEYNRSNEATYTYRVSTLLIGAGFSF